MNIFRILLPIGVLGTAIGIAAYLMATKPEPKRHPKSSSMTSVQAVRLESQDYQVRLRSYGTVSARTRSTLISEISGKILGISPSFREGGFFEEGDLLIEIEPYDYETAVMVAESALAQVQNALEQEEARHQQAIEDWNRLGDGGQPTALTLRKPQSCGSGETEFGKNAYHRTLRGAHHEKAGGCRTVCYPGNGSCRYFCSGLCRDSNSTYQSTVGLY